MANNKLITTNFKLNNIKQFIESISEPANTIYYVFGGKPTQYILGDNFIDAPDASVETLLTKVYDEMVFAKQVSSNDVKPMTHRYDWTLNTVYDMYDSLDAELEEKPFFVVSPEGGTFYVYKCLFNNNGANATSQPLYSATGADDVLYETADGYIWKYMYEIDATTFNKFATTQFIPVIPDANVSSNAVSGAIDVIKIESGGKFYNNYLFGSFTSADTRFGGISEKYRITAGDASPTDDFYTGCIIKIVSGTGAGQYRKIVDYVIADGFKFIFIDTPFTTIPTSSIYEISPQIIVQGDDRQTINAVARALINTNSSNSIYKLDILDRGKGYFTATANAFATAVVRTSNSVNDAVLRPIIGPKGGHGSDVESELYCSHLGISVKFSNNENDTISTENDFRTIGIIKDPKFYNVKLNYNDAKGPGFIDTEEVLQLNLKRLGGSVGVSSTSKNVIGLGTLTTLSINSAGNTIYSNTDIITISNVATNAICNLTTTSTGNLESIQVVSAGFGFSDTETALITVANSSGGNVRHVNSRIITDVNYTANGLAYTNADYIEISSTSATINATANLVTNATGGITSIVLNNSGKGFACNEIAYINIDDGGSNYDSTVNNQLAFSGGGGTGAIATFANDGSGVITSISIINRGIGYTSAPTIAPVDTSGSSALFTAILQANGLSIKIANSTDGFSNGAKIMGVVVTANGAEGLYSNTDFIVFPSTSDANGNAVANVITTEVGQLLTVDVNAGNNFGFNIANADSIDAYAANSTGGYLRYFNSNIVSSITVSNSSPAYQVASVQATANGQNYNSTKVLRVDVVDGGVGYDSIANNVLIFSGTGTGANATFVNNSLGSIISVTMVANGSGYTAAPAVTANAQAGGIGANLSAVLANSITFSSTSGGYGAVAFFTNTAGGNVATITVANAGFGYTIAPTAVISDPVGTDAILTVSINGVANSFATNDVIFVTNGSIDAIANAVANSTLFLTDATLTNSGKDFNADTLFVFIANSSSGNIRYFNNTYVKDIAIANGGYPGFCSNDDVLTISGGTINAIANITSNSTGGLSSLLILNRGLGFVNNESLSIRLVNSSNTDLRFLNTNTVSTYEIRDGGVGYNNTDFIIVSSSSGVNAAANIETSTTGIITSIQFTNRGSELTPSYISEIRIIDGGSGYSNADIINIFGGGGTGANAILLTNTSGGIIQTYVVDGGINYDCAPSIVIANSSGGNSSGSSANLIASIEIPYTVRIFNANNNPSAGNFADISINIAPAATLNVSLAIAPTIGNTSAVVALVSAADLDIDVADSANLQFTSTLAANVSINLTGQLTSFDSSIGAGDFIYINSASDETDLLLVNSVTNATHLTVTTFPQFTSNAVAISVANIQAQGNVLDVAPGYINVTNVTGFFAQANIVYGLVSKSSGNVTAISFNDVVKNGSTINQLFYYGVSSLTGTFEEDEIIYAGSATARYHSGNSTALYVTNPTGLFFPGNTVTGNSSGALAVLTSGNDYRYDGDFIRGSGDIIYIENIEPIARANSQSETIKVIVEF